MQDALDAQWVENNSKEVCLKYTYIHSNLQDLMKLSQGNIMKIKEKNILKSALAQLDWAKGQLIPE